MEILVGQKLPNATLSYFGSDGVSQIELAEFLKGKKVVIFALPGAFTNTCSSKHLPGFIEKSSLIKDKGVNEITVLPLYPHYAMSSYESVVVKVDEEIEKNFNDIKTNIIPAFYNDKLYLRTLVNQIKSHLDKIDYDHILFSYHGIPESHIRISDPTNHHCKIGSCCDKGSVAHNTCYRHQVFQTTKSIVKQLGIKEGSYSNAFQSRLANEPWLKPYTDSELERLAKDGVKKMVVITPAFVTDCLETLEEIAMEAKEEFLEAGGEEFHYIPCLNDGDEWAQTIAAWSKQY